MARKEFVRLMEENVFILDKLGDKLRLDSALITNYPRQQLTALVRLHIGGRAMLKDIARREHVTAPNLCATFRKLEGEGLVQRTIDEDDRRNTWYSVTPAGAELASRVLDKFREGIEILFSSLEKEDKKKLTESMKVMNEIVKKMEIGNA